MTKAQRIWRMKARVYRGLAEITWAQVEAMSRDELMDICQELSWVQTTKEASHD